MRVLVLAWAWALSSSCSPGGLLSGSTNESSEHVAHFNETECGEDKGCFLPEDIHGQPKASWRLDNGSLLVELAGKRIESFYVAIGFSKDQIMGEDYVFYCATNSPGHFFIAVNLPYGQTYFSDRVKTFLEDPPFTDIHVASDGALYCSFHVPLAVLPQASAKLPPAFASLNQSYFLFLALGRSPGFGSIERHSGRAYSEQARNVVLWGAMEEGNTYLSFSTVRRLEKCHGALMVFSWLFAMTCSMIGARYLKNSRWGTRVVWGRPGWYQAHRGFNLFAVSCMAVALVAILVSRKGKWRGPRVGQPSPINDYQLHCLYGVLCVAVSFSQPLFAALRPHGESRFRGLFVWWHRLAGLSAWILSAMTLWQAANFPYLSWSNASSAPRVPQAVLGSFWALTALLVAALEAHYWLCARSTGSIVRWDRPRTIVFVVFCLIAFILSLVTMIVISAYDP